MQRRLAERELTSEGPSLHAPHKGGRSATVNLAESPLSWLFARGHVSERQLMAGEKLRFDWEAAQMAPRMTMSWNPVRVQGGDDRGLNASERQIAAKARFDAAIASAGPGLADVLWRVVCAGESVPDAERGLEWPVRSGKLVLKLALDRLVDFYRLG